MAEKDKSGKKAGGGLFATVTVFGFVTVLAVGAGWYLGSRIRTVTQAQIESASVTETGAARKSEIGAPRSREQRKTEQGSQGHGGETAADASHGAIQSFFGGPSSVKLEPIICNIGASGDEWMRLQIAVVYGPDAGTVSDAEKYEINEAIIAMMRRKDKSDLDGPSGFLHFREDLVDTVMISTGGRATSAKILSMVVE